MTETARFFLLLAAAAVLAAGAILAMRNPRVAEARARAFFWICVFAGAAVLLERAGIAGGVLRSVRPIEQAYALVRWIVLGAAAASAILAFAAPGRASFARSAWTLRGLCASTALGFLAIEAGKLAHDAEMRAFFTSSGYPVPMMYTVMGAEALGAIGLLLPGTRAPPPPRSRCSCSARSARMRGTGTLSRIRWMQCGCCCCWRGSPFSLPEDRPPAKTARSNHR